jgi:hypothetical protein
MFEMAETDALNGEENLLPPSLEIKFNSSTVPVLDITDSLPVLSSSSILRRLKDGRCMLRHRWSDIARWVSFN